MTVPQPRTIHLRGQRYVLAAALPGPHDLFLTPQGDWLEVYAPDAQHPDGVLIGHVQEEPGQFDEWVYTPGPGRRLRPGRTSVSTRNLLKNPRAFLTELRAAGAIPEHLTGVWWWPEDKEPRKLL